MIYGWLVGIIAALAGGFTALARVYKWGPFADKIDPMPPDFTTIEVLPPTPPVEPNPAPTALLWATPRQAYHSVRVLCDEMGLTYQQKNILCACVYQESQFLNTARGYNRDANGNILSTDFGSALLGVAQVNDFWHIGPGKTFPSIKYVIDNPEEVIRWMIGIYKRTGKLQPWVSWTSGAYKKWLLPNSPMWDLAKLGAADNEEVDNFKKELGMGYTFLV